MNPPPPVPRLISVLWGCLAIQLIILAVAAYDVYLGGSRGSFVLFGLNTVLLISLIIARKRSHRQHPRGHFAHHTGFPGPAE